LLHRRRRESTEPPRRPVRSARGAGGAYDRCMSDIEQRARPASARPAAMPPARLHGRAALLLFVVACLAFAGLAADLLVHGPITAADAPISTWFHEHGRAPLTAFLRTISDLHSTASVLTLAALAGAVLLWRREGAWVIPLVLCVPGGMLLNVLVKNQFQRVRPSFEHPLVTIASYSFPSGHTAAATLAWGFALVWLFAHRSSPRERLLATVIAVAMVLLTAVSRVYLGAHYVSDVLAAAAEALAWLALCWFVLGEWPWRIVVGAPR
jgi:membrane-associated phospholipid phosphatase